MSKGLTASVLAKYIDHTVLRPEATEADIRKLCDEAIEYSMKSVCVERRWLNLVVSLLSGSNVLPITVVSFPSGADGTDEKRRQTREALELGAKEIDMVLNRALLQEKNYRRVFRDIDEVVASAQGNPVKVILENSELTDSEKRIACALAKAAGASFVKTSTGFSKTGATVADVKLMRETVGADTGVKASGGIRAYQDVLAMIEAGANRIGTSSSVLILREAIERVGR